VKYHFKKAIKESKTNLER